MKENKHIIIKQHLGRTDAIGPFKDYKEADEYRNRKVKAMRKEEDKGNPFSPPGTVSFMVTGLLKPQKQYMDPAEPKTCGCCEHRS